jgi:hypothetical protein
MPTNPTKALHAPACNGCPHQKNQEDPDGIGFCYMFKNAPDTLPCCQKELSTRKLTPKDHKTAMAAIRVLAIQSMFKN